MLTVAHPWHGVHYGANAPRVVNALIEIPQGSRAKYEIDKDSGLLKLDRIIYSSFYYPCNYGFIPQTYGDDKDPLDILVITSQPVQAMCLMEAKVVGVMHMVDSGDADDKIIAVAANDPSVRHYNNHINGFPGAYHPYSDRPGSRNTQRTSGRWRGNYSRACARLFSRL